MNELSEATKPILAAMGKSLGTVNLLGRVKENKNFMVFAMKNQEPRVVSLVHDILARLTEMLDGVGSDKMPPDWDEVQKVLYVAYTEMDIEGFDEKTWPEVYA